VDEPVNINMPFQDALGADEDEDPTTDAEDGA
jgi:hypothetical protein